MGADGQSSKALRWLCGFRGGCGSALHYHLGVWAVKLMLEPPRATLLGRKWAKKTHVWEEARKLDSG